MGVIGLAAFLYAVARGLNPVCNYAFGHWLLTWNAGFIKRGFVGTLLHPFVAGRPSGEIRDIVTALSCVAFTVLGALLLRAAWRVAGCANPSDWRTPGAWALPAVALAFLSSSGIIVAASTLGFFDHLLLLLTLCCVDLIARGRFAWAGALCVLALSIHEIFAVYGLPVVGFAMLLQIRGREADPRAWRSLAWLAPATLFAGFITWSGSALPAARIHSVRLELASLGALSPRQIGFAVYHLEHGLSANVAAQHGWAARHLLDPAVDRVAWPAILLLIAASAVLLFDRPRWRRSTLAALFAAALAPLLAHIVAWDATRFTNFAVMQAFACLYAAVAITRPPAPGPRASAILLLLALAALGATLYWPTPLMSGHVDGGGILGVR